MTRTTIARLLAEGRRIASADEAQPGEAVFGDGGALWWAVPPDLASAVEADLAELAAQVRAAGGGPEDEAALRASVFAALLVA